MHNPKAGEGKHDGAKLKRRLEKAGHTVRYQSTKKSGYKKALDRPADIVLAAGGDGTIGKVARRLISRNIPLSVLPLGTANNLARSLGFEDQTQDPLAALEKTTTNRFDVGQVRAPCGRQILFEGAGVGLLADYLRVPGRIISKQHKELALTPREEILRHVNFLLRAFLTYRSVPATLTVDGEVIADRFLLIQALNIRSIGPVLTLAPHAQTGDGYFDLVLAREEDREKLTSFLEARLRHEEAAFPIPARRFRNLTVEWEDSGCHVDDEYWPKKRKKIPPGPHRLEIAVDPGALVTLRPKHA